MDYPSIQMYIPHPRKLYSFVKSYGRTDCFDLSTVHDVLNYYGMELIRPPKPVTTGMRNESLVLDTSHGPKFLKRYRESLGESTIIQEHSILKYLHRKGYPSVRLESTQNHETLLNINQQRYALFDFVNGFHIYEYIFSSGNLKKFIYLAGYMLGKLHHQLKDFKPEGYNPDGFNYETGKRWRDIEWFKLQIEDIKGVISSDLPKNQKRISKTLIGEIEALWKNLYDLDKLLHQANLPWQVVHIDFGRSNILYRKKKLPVVIDFEIARVDWKLIDIINGWNGFCLDKHGFNVDKMKIFLKAYREEQYLSDDEFFYIPTVYKYLTIARCIMKLKNYCVQKKNISPSDTLHFLRHLRNNQVNLPKL